MLLSGIEEDVVPSTVRIEIVDQANGSTVKFYARV
mgnify:CR=1 FL=1